MNKDKTNTRTRYRRLASSIDEMAKSLLVMFYSNDGWIVAPLRETFEEYEDAVKAAKEWLMKMERGK